MLEPTETKELSLSKKEKKDKDKADKKAEKAEKKEKEKLEKLDKGGFFTKKRSSSLRQSPQNKDSKEEGAKDDSHILVRTSSKDVTTLNSSRKNSNAKDNVPVVDKEKDKRSEVCCLFYLIIFWPIFCSLFFHFESGLVLILKNI